MVNIKLYGINTMSITRFRKIWRIRLEYIIYQKYLKSKLDISKSDRGSVAR